MMWIGIAIAVVVIVVAVASKLIGAGNEAGSQNVAFAGVSLKAKPVINATEARVYENLLKAVPPGYWVFPAVRLADLMAISASDNSARQSALNRISSKHVDFAIVRSSDRLCVTVVEVDGPDHEKKNQKERDSIKDAALQQAGIRLVRLPAGDYSPAELAQRLGAQAPAPSPNTRR